MYVMVIECSTSIESRNERMAKLVNCYSNFKLVHSIAIEISDNLDVNGND